MTRATLSAAVIVSSLRLPQSALFPLRLSLSLSLLELQSLSIQCSWELSSRKKGKLDEAACLSVLVTRISGTPFAAKERKTFETQTRVSQQLREER